MIESYVYGLYLGVKTLPHIGDPPTNTYNEDMLVSHSVCRRDAAEADAMEQLTFGRHLATADLSALCLDSLSWQCSVTISSNLKILLCLYAVQRQHLVSCYQSRQCL